MIADELSKMIKERILIATGKTVPMKGSDDNDENCIYQTRYGCSKCEHNAICRLYCISMSFISKTR